MPAAPGRVEVFLPGEPEILSRLHRSVGGIAVPEPTWKDLGGLADRFCIPLPVHRVV
jgi:LDH2 family malate/lactate/ureidoglycolate dehydrogenase